MKCASKQDKIISSGQNFFKGKNVNKVGKIPTLPKRRDCQQSVSKFICGLAHISEIWQPALQNIIDYRDCFRASDFIVKPFDFDVYYKSDRTSPRLFTNDVIYMCLLYDWEIH